MKAYAAFYGDNVRIISVEAENKVDATAALVRAFDEHPILKDYYRDRWISDGRIVREVDEMGGGVTTLLWIEGLELGVIP